MKKLLLLPIFILPTFCFAKALTDFEQIKSAAISGKLLRTVTDFSQCVSSLKTPPSNKPLFGVYTFNEMLVNSEHITSSLTHFTLNNPKFPSVPVIEFVNYIITADNQVNVTTQLLDAKNYARLSDKVSYDCGLNAAAKIYSE